MKSFNKIILICCSILVISGCSDDQKSARMYAANEEARKACLTNGGVPLQSWFNAEILGDCVYKPVD